jgi:hypothetical protein
MFVSTKKVSQDKVAAKTSDNSNFNSDKTTDRLDVNKLKIDVEASFEVCNVITCLQAKSTAIDTVANIKSLSDKVVSHNLNKLKILKSVIKNNIKEKDFICQKERARDKLACKKIILSKSSYCTTEYLLNTVIL